MKIDLAMIRRVDGKSAHDALASEPLGIAISYHPDPELDPDDIRVLVIRWPAFVTAILALWTIALLAGSLR